MRRLLKGNLGLFRKQAGFTFIEIVVALGIMGVITAGLLTALNTNARATRTLDEKIMAANLAAAYVEAIKDAPFAASYSVGDNVSVPFQYEVTINTLCSSDATSFGPCTGSANETFQKITIQISREDRPVMSLCSYRTKR